MTGAVAQRTGDKSGLPNIESLRVFLDSLQALVCYVDAQRCYRFNNKAYETWFGRPRHEITGRPVREIVGEAAFQVLDGYMDQVFAGQRVTFNRWMPLDPSRPTYVRSTFVPDVDANGRVVGFFALVEDLTDLLSAGADLRTALDRLSNRVDDYVAGVAAPRPRPVLPPVERRRPALQALGDGDSLARDIIEATSALVVVSSAAGLIILVNRACEWLSGYRRDELLGKPLLTTLAPAPWRAAIADHLAAAGQGGPCQPVEMPIVCADGRLRPVVWRFSPLPIGGERVGRLGLGFEVSGDPIAAQPLFRRRDRRFHRVVRRYAVTEVTAALLHELSQPLSAVLGFTQGSLRLLDRSGGERSAEVIQSLEKAAGQAHRLGEIVRRVRGQVRTDDRSRTRTLIDVNTIITAAVSRSRAEAAAAGIALLTDFGDRLPPISCDPAAIEYVLMSIIGDSVDAIESQAARPRWIRLWSTSVGESVEISITDSGPGIANLVAGRLFDPFIDGKLTGHGLGLAVCRTMVREHGGDLWLEEQDSGSVFRLNLPCPTEESADVG